MRIQITNCDRCGKEIKEETRAGHSEPEEQKIFEESYGSLKNGITIVDLCKECKDACDNKRAELGKYYNEEIEKFFKNKSEVKENGTKRRKGIK